MFKELIVVLFLIVSIGFAKGIDKNSSKDLNSSDKNSSNYEKSNIQKAIENEKKFEKEQKFYMGEDYNLSQHKVDQKTIDKVKAIEPEYDFDITDVYAD